MKKTRDIAGLIFAIALLLRGDASMAGFLHASDDGGGNGPDVNLIVREVKVAPIRAHVGDKVRIDILVENRGDLIMGNTRAEVRANGRVVADQLYTYGMGGDANRFQRLSITWDTAGMKAGEFKVRGEVFVWGDASPFDNYLDAPEPLKLLPQGTAFPAGEPEGGESVGRDQRYKPLNSISDSAGRRAS